MTDRNASREGEPDDAAASDEPAANVEPAPMDAAPELLGVPVTNDGAR